MGLVQVCAIEEIFSTLREPKQDMLRLSASQKRYDATVATQNGHVATLLDRNLRATTAEKIFCDFAQLKNNMLRLCAIRVICTTLVCSFGSRFAIYILNESTKKWYVSTVSTQARSVLTELTQFLFVWALFDRGRTFRLSSTEQKDFDQVQPRKNVTNLYALKSELVFYIGTI